MKKSILCNALAVGLGFGIASTAMAKTVTVDEDVLKSMQQQLAAQAKAIADLQTALKGQQDKLDKVPEFDEKEQAVVIAKPDNSKIQVALYGQVDKGVLYADDGNKDKTFFVDNDASSTRIGIKGDVKPDGRLSAGTLMEFEYQTNPSNKVSMDNESINEDFNVRKLSFYLADETLGRLTVGQDSAVTDGLAEIDLSGTALAGYADAAVIGGGLSFYDNMSNSYSKTTVSSAFIDLDGGRYDLVRYDSPKLYGFSLAGSVGEESKNEIALNYSKQFDLLKVAGGVGYANEGNKSSHDDRWLGSASTLLNNGLSFTFATGTRSESDDQRHDPYFYYGKIGYQFKAFTVGKTALSLDYGNYQDFALNNDEGTLFGAQLVQDLDILSSQFYLGYRQLQLDRDLVDLNDIYAITSGMRMKF
jgi:hypothetical protein